jgi:tetratricopeptide (TPR) repeat protein
MSKKKIVKTASASSVNAATGSNIIVINNSPSTNTLKYLDVFIEGMSEVKGHAQIALIHPKAEEWKKLSQKKENISQAIENGKIRIEKTVMDLDVDYSHIFFLPLKHGKNKLDYAQVIRTLSNKYKDSNELIALGKNKNSKEGFGSKLFGFIANCWARIMHGIEASNIASGIIGFKKETYQLLNEKYGHKGALSLFKLGYEENLEFQSIEGNFGNLNYGFGAGFGALYNSKMAIFGTLIPRFVSSPLKAIKSDGIQITKKDSPFFKLSFFIASCIIFFIMAFTATDFNVTWDEPGHLEYSEDVLAYHSSLGEDTTLFDFSKSKSYLENYVLYGASVDTIAEAIHSITSFNIYSIRRYLNGLIGFLLLLIIGLFAQYLFGWRAALIAILAAFLSPSFYGHFFNNHKDIPFALGYAMTAYYLVILLNELPKPKFQTMFMLALGVGFSLSVRASGLAQFGIVFAFMGLHWLLNAEKGKNLIPYLSKFAGMALVAYIIGIALWPYALRDPLSGPISAFKEFSNFSSLHYMELFEGIRIKDKPWYYEPKLILITAPLMAVFGWILFALTAVIKRNKKRSWALWVILLMTLAPTAYTIYQGSYLYNGWRHFLFVYPTLLILAVWGFEKLVELFKNVQIAKIVIPILAVILLIPALIFNIKNHPYQYMYFNEIVGGVEGAHGNYDLDYWSQTPKEAVKWLINHDPKVKDGEIKVVSNNIVQTLNGQVPEAEKLKYDWTREMQWYDRAYEYAIFTTRTLSKSQILEGNWPPKGTIHEIKVDGATVAAVVKKENDYASSGYYALRDGKIAEAEAFYKKAYNYNPKEEEYVRGLAKVYKAKRSWDTAAKYFKEATVLRDRNYEAHYHLGEIYLNKASLANPSQPDPKLIALAKENFEKTVEYKSNYNTAYYYLGTLALAEKRDYDAMKEFRRTLAVDPSMGAAYVGMGKAFSNIGNVDSAIVYFSYAAQVNQARKINNPEPFYYLAQLYQRKGDQKSAQQYMQMYQQMAGGSVQ